MKLASIFTSKKHTQGGRLKILLKIPVDDQLHTVLSS